jgi:glycosyltransferase involved in cell wall biosynthesis
MPGYILTIPDCGHDHREYFKSTIFQTIFFLGFFLSIPGASLIISVYQNVGFLRLVFAGIERQTHQDFEVVIADDGSDNRMKDFLASYQSSAPFPVRHVWHERAGWQKNKILNTAIRSSQSNYLIFIDGDCIPHRHFVDGHIKAQKPGRVLCGRRVMLSERITRVLDVNAIRSGTLEGLNAGLLLDAFRGHASRLEDGMYFPVYLQNLLPQSHNRILGSNFSIEKSLMEKINGFDEEYTGPGIGEDADVQFRLELLDVLLYSVKHRAIQYHLYHPRTHECDANKILFAQKKKAGLAFCKNGLTKPA